MKRLLTTASVLATLAIPALASAHGYQDQSDRPERPVPAQARPQPSHPAPNVVMKVNPTVHVVQRPAWNHGDPNWWRGRPEFRGYAGARPGYWYRPGFGYTRVDPRWYGYSWRVGGYVPVEFRGYYVQNPYLFGLGAAPYGYAYVYLGNNIALMSTGSGMIVQVFPNVY